MRCSLDTNVLVYAEGFGDEVRVSAARHVLERLEPDDVVIPVQCLGELFRVLTTKAGRSRADAQEAVLSWMDSYSLDVPLGCLGRLKQASLATCVIPLAHEGQGFVDFIAHLPEVDRIGESPYHQAWLCQYFRQKADRPLPLGSAGGLPNDGRIPAGGRCPPAGLHSGSPPHPPRPAERRRHKLVIPSPVPSNASAPRPSRST